MRSLHNPADNSQQSAATNISRKPGKGQKKAKFSKSANHQPAKHLPPAASQKPGIFEVIQLPAADKILAAS
jgi:hypothetical protein